MEEYIVFMEAGVYPEQKCLLKLAEALQMEPVEMASPMTNCFMADRNNRITGKENLLHNRLYYQDVLKCRINRNFIKDCLDIFMNHPQIGMECMAFSGFISRLPVYNGK